MKNWILGLLLVGLLIVSLQGTPSPSSQQEASRVVLVTIDGVRREELLGHLDLTLDPKVTAAYDPMPFFNQTLRKRAHTIGLEGSGTIMTVANTEFISLPAYMTMMAGQPQPCFSNECGPVFMTRPLPERLIKDLKWDQKDVAVFASWENIKHSIMTEEGQVLVSAGPSLVDLGDEELNNIQRQAMEHLPPWAHARWDVYTMELARNYWRKHHPRFMYIALNDTDEWGHKGQYDQHLAALTKVDQFLEQLVSDTIEQDRRDEQRTCLLITTDHGRGLGSKWTTHSNGAPYSGLIWALGGCDLDQESPDQMVSDAPPVDSLVPKVYSHLDIRPTLETWLGLPPRRCSFCGSPIEAFSRG